MRRSVPSALFLAITALASPLSAQEPAWTALLQDNTLDNWNRTGDANWRITAGIAEADAGFGHLVTKEIYGDFELKAEFWVGEGANSGILFRCSDVSWPTSSVCYEANIFDTRPDQTYGTGAIINFASIGAPPKVSGRWNTYHIRAEGDHLTVTLNGKRTAEVRDRTYARGPITLQHGKGVVKFRNVLIRPL